MYNREERFKVDLEEDLGPGYYNNEYDSVFPSAVADYAAPFLSSVKRFPQKSSSIHACSNTYKIRDEMWNPPGGYFWLSTSKRFEESPPFRPRSRMVYNFRLGNGRCAKPTENLCTIRRSLRVPRNPQNRTPPSIPDRLSMNGYEFNPDGSIYRVDPKDNDTTIGPAYYNVPSGEQPCLTRLLYKGNFWSHDSSQRHSYANCNPGPSDYNVTSIPKKELLHFPVNSLYVPRYLDELVYNELKQDTPGPAGYFIPDPFRMNLMDLCCGKAPFGSSTKRFSEIKTSPGPETCPVVSSFSRCQFQNSSLAPFGATAPRFIDAHHDGCSPEPNRYYLEGFADKAQCNILHSKITARTQLAPFGSNTPRMKSPPEPFEIIPQLEKKTLMLDLSPRPEKTVRRRTRRLVPSKAVYPAPGDHEVTKVMLYLRQKTSHRKPPTRKVDPAGFLVSSRRFSESNTTGKSRFEKCKHPKKYISPGPGAYNLLPSTKSSKLGISFSKQDRFPECPKTRWPSPTSYMLSPNRYHTLLQSTYNATLDSKLPRNYGAKWRPAHMKHDYSTVDPSESL